MKNIIVLCEIEEGTVIDVSLELLSKGRKLANELNCKLEALVVGKNLAQIENQIYPYGVDILHVAEDNRLEFYQTLPFTKIAVDVLSRQQPQAVLVGATTVGRDLAPRVASSLRCGLTADCTSLVIGEHFDKKADKQYEQLLYQIRPAFGGNIIATIINPEMHPQMATVREGVMKKEIYNTAHQGVRQDVELDQILTDDDFVVEILERHIEKSKVNIKGSQIIVAGGYGVGSKANFDLLFELANVLGGEVAGSRAAVDAGYIQHERQVGQTGVTVRPKLYIACGISGAVQHRAGMDQSAQIISINTDEKAPINQIADYTILGDVADVIPKMIKYYKKNTK